MLRLAIRRKAQTVEDNKKAIDELIAASRRQTKKTNTPADKLEAMAATFRERNKVYGDNYLRLGHSMHSMFPNGLTVNTPEDWTRLYFFFLQQVKVSRYATNFNKGGHADSVHDAAIYGALLESFDERIRAESEVGARDGDQARGPRSIQESSNDTTGRS